MRALHSRLRKHLRAADDGLTILDLAALSGHREDVLRASLKTMPDAYIDRYLPPVRGQYPAVWCVVVPPPHCPKPATKGLK